MPGGFCHPYDEGDDPILQPISSIATTCGVHPRDMTEILELLAETHPVSAIATQLRERAAEEREIERQRGEDAIAVLERISTLLAKQSSDQRKAVLLDVINSIESIVNEIV